MATAKPPTLILASASPRRAELLAQLEIDYQVVPSHVPEVEGPNLSAGEVALINACRKARAIAKKFPDAVVLGVDTVVALGSTLFGKPANLAEAHAMLLDLQGKSHHVVTGVCLIHARRHRRRMFFEHTEVTFRALNTEQIQRYLAQTNPLDKAGGYGIQEKGDLLVESVSGSYSNVVGLPLERLQMELMSFGILQPAF
jgi:septum formation protein